MHNIANNSRCGLLTYSLCPAMQKIEYDAGRRDQRYPNCENCAKDRNSCVDADGRACSSWRPGGYEGVKEQSYCPTCTSTCCPFNHTPGTNY